MNRRTGSQAVWSELAKFRHFGTKFKTLAIFWGYIKHLAKFVANFGQFLNAIGQFFIVVNGQMLSK